MSKPIKGVININYHEITIAYHQIQKMHSLLIKAQKRSPFYSKIDSSSFGIQLYKSEALFSPCYGNRPKSGWIASVALFKFSAEVLRCFEATSRGNFLNW